MNELEEFMELKPDRTLKFTETANTVLAALKQLSTAFNACYCISLSIRHDRMQIRGFQLSQQQLEQLSIRADLSTIVPNFNGSLLVNQVHISH